MEPDQPRLDVPAPDEFFEVATYFARWPTGAEKAELMQGILIFQGDFDHRDVEIAQRAYPGRLIVLNQSGGLEVHPAPGTPGSPPAPLW